MSEVEQLIRLTNHPSLVKTPSVNASAGAGAVIEMPEELEPNLKPYLLQPSGQNLQAIMESISNKVNAINRIAHTGAVRTTKQAVSSGIALQTEFELLNARLSEKADNLQIAEEQIFRLYALFQNATFDGEINSKGPGGLFTILTVTLFVESDIPSEVSARTVKV